MRYVDINARFRNRAELIAEIEAVTVGQPISHWIARFESEGVPCAPIQDYGQSFADPHLLARDYFWNAPHATLGTVRQLGSPMRFSTTPARQERAGPLLGEDTRAVLSELGCTAAEIDELVSMGITTEPARDNSRHIEEG